MQIVGDVYSGVKDEVLKLIARDARDDSDVSAEIRELAKKLNGLITRKMVKQTVMTSTYGVTEYGAKAQIRKWMEDAFVNKNLKTFNEQEFEEKIKSVAQYVAELIINAIGLSNTPAWIAMLWLKDCANKIAKTGHRVNWITPLGLPCVQHYALKKRAVYYNIVSLCFVFGAFFCVGGLKEQCIL